MADRRVKRYTGRVGCYKGAVSTERLHAVRCPVYLIVQNIVSIDRFPIESCSCITLIKERKLPAKLNRFNFQSFVHVPDQQRRRHLALSMAQDMIYSRQIQPPDIQPSDETDGLVSREIAYVLGGAQIQPGAVGDPGVSTTTSPPYRTLRSFTSSKLIETASRQKNHAKHHPEN